MRGSFPAFRKPVRTTTFFHIMLVNLTSIAFLSDHMHPDCWQSHWDQFKCKCYTRVILRAAEKELGRDGAQQLNILIETQCTAGGPNSGDPAGAQAPMSTIERKNARSLQHEAIFIEVSFATTAVDEAPQIGRASCRERVF